MQFNSTSSNCKQILRDNHHGNLYPQNIICATHTVDQRAKNGMSVLICFWAALSKIVYICSFQ